MRLICAADADLAFSSAAYCQGGTDLGSILWSLGLQLKFALDGQLARAARLCLVLRADRMLQFEVPNKTHSKLMLSGKGKPHFAVGCISSELTANVMWLMQLSSQAQLSCTDHV